MKTVTADDGRIGVLQMIRPEGAPGIVFPDGVRCFLYGISWGHRSDDAYRWPERDIVITSQTERDKINAFIDELAAGDRARAEAWNAKHGHTS